MYTCCVSRRHAFSEFIERRLKEVWWRILKEGSLRGEFNLARMSRTRSKLPNANNANNHPTNPEKKCFVFGSSTPRDLSYMHNIPPILRTYDSRLTTEKPKQGETLSHYMREARSATRKKTGNFFLALFHFAWPLLRPSRWVRFLNGSKPLKMESGDLKWFVDASRWQSLEPVRAENIATYCWTARSGKLMCA